MQDFTDSNDSLVIFKPIEKYMLIIIISIFIVMCACMKNNHYQSSCHYSVSTVNC